MQFAQTKFDDIKETYLLVFTFQNCIHNHTFTLKSTFKGSLWSLHKQSIIQQQLIVTVDFTVKFTLLICSCV